ncbi:riboflavin synthase subunit alpha, partial [Candidatus Curtissbacteria bacterium RBG_13_35_7]
MFTGIVSYLGKVQSIKSNTLVFEVDKILAKKLKKGDSISINGACLTIENKSVNSFGVHIIGETRKRTNLGLLKSSDLVNLELPMAVNGKFAGHIVQGHIDGVGLVKSIKKERNSCIFSFKVTKFISKYIVEKGSIAVNGVSLTVISVKADSFTVGIIPYTWENTNFKILKTGDKV